MLKDRLKNTDSLEVFSGIGILLFIVGCPYFLSNHYFSMTLAKTLFFFGSSAFFAIGCLVLRRRLKKRVRIPLIRKNNTERFFLLFIGLGFVSCVCAMNPTEAFIGGMGRNMGMMMFLFIFLAYIFVSRFGQFKTPVVMIFGVSLFVMTVISFLQFCRLDPFGLYEGTKDTVKRGFMSMLGNKDVYYSYLSLTVPFSLYLIFEAEYLWEKIFWYVVGFSGFVGILICNCEGGYICLAVTLLFFLLVKCRDKNSLLVFLRILMLLFLACLLISCLRFNFARKGITVELLTGLFISPIFYGIGLPVSVVLYVLAMRSELPDRFFVILRKAVGIAAAVVFAVVAALFVYFSFINTTANIGRFITLFRFSNPRWGSGRGAIWKQMATIYAELPWYRKLIGAGQESIVALMKQYFPDVVATDETLLDNAHNEYLHYLLTHGLLGLIAYLLFVVSALRRGFREGGRYQRAAALGACCYLAQSTFNIIQALTTPMFFVFLALTQTVDIDVPKKVRVHAADGAEDASTDGPAGEDSPEPETVDAAAETPDASAEASPEDMPEDAAEDAAEDAQEDLPESAAEIEPAEASAEKMPGAEPSEEEMPAEEMPAVEPSSEELSPETPSADEIPSQEAPAEEAPVEETANL